ncbi:hypothetical protein PBI_AN9_66 [Mycobacterium phage AN9]|nr:hypothetical protein PBI_ANI8_66 [Mycobacterium phage ANI8]QJD52620.1 hypothetical protein PBI_AN9_66 [Mycobacterium phage AN9]
MEVGPMNISVKILGFEIASVELEFGDDEPTPVADTVVETVVDRMSDWWVKRMLKRR